MTVADDAGAAAGSRPQGLNETVSRLAKDIAMLDPGSAAALRRGPLAGSGAAAFWKLLADYGIASNLSEQWAAVVQSIAILTAVGQDAGGIRQSAHDPNRPMGAALYGARVSELRLARLLAAKGNMRRDLVVRVCRRLAHDAEHRRFDLRTLVRFIVFDDERTDRHIARDYYRREREEAASRARDSQTMEE